MLRLLFQVLPGEYIAAGKQGSARLGEVALTADLQPNKDLMAARSYDLNHQRAGTVSLNLSRSDDDPMVQQGRAYRNVSFLITTGTTLNCHPSWCPLPRPPLLFS